MKTEELLLIGLGAFLVLQSQKKTPAGSRTTTIPNAGVPTTSPGGMAGSPGGIIDQIVSVGQGVYDSIVNGTGQLPSVNVGTTAVGNSFAPADPGDNRIIALMGYRPSASAVSATSVKVGVPGTAAAPTPTTRVKSPAGIVGYSPFAN